jgi:iron complex transport system ATP-binding protein
MQLELLDVRFRYNSHPILEGVSLSVDPARIVAVCGPNGVGKSTLIKCINRILDPEGAVLLDARKVRRMPLRHIARRIGYVPQDLGALLGVTVFDLVLMGRRPHLQWRASARDEAKVFAALERMGIASLALRDINQLSGGQRQKAVIARALAQEPELLLMDEPTSNLDLRHQLEVMDLLQNMVAEKRLSVLMAVHDLNLASRYADQLILMKAGAVYAAGTPADVLTPSNIRSVYGVVAEVKQEQGRPYVVPIRHAPAQGADNPGA